MYHTPELLRKLFDSFRNLNILVIGDVMVDSYLWGKVERISSEAPVPVVSVSREENRPGGAANVALNIQALGARPLLCSVIGSDRQGDVFMGLLKKNNIPSQGIMVSPKRITTLKTRIIGNSHQMLRVDTEDDSNISETETDQFLNIIINILDSNSVHAILFEDYDKGVITPRLISEITKKAHSKSIPVVVDPKRRNFNAYRNADIFKPNLKELCEGLKMDIDPKSKEEVNQAIEKLSELIGNRYTLLTLSELGMVIAGGGETHWIPAKVRRVSDVSGAGDTVVSVAALCHAAGASPLAMAAMANLAGGLVCEKVGVVPVDAEELFNSSLAYFREQM